MNHVRQRVSWLLVCLTLFASAAAVHAEGPARAPKWEYVEDNDNVRLWKLEVPGQDLPGFRGQTVIDASIDDILAVMLKWQKHTDWMYRCAESKLLKELNDKEALMYNRTSAPWPVWDRDVIVTTRIQWSADKKHLAVTFHNVDSTLKAPPEHTIRMPRLVGFYKMWEVGPKQTRIMYQVDSDIGGSIPTWLAVRATKDLPHITLVSLKKRVTGKDD